MTYLLPQPRDRDNDGGAVLLRGAALPYERVLLVALAGIAATSPFRRMATAGDFTMPVAMTNCGAAGWLTDRTGYRYHRNNPDSGQPWVREGRQVAFSIIFHNAAACPHHWQTNI